jgi:hypothetical protein
MRSAGKAVAGVISSVRITVTDGTLLELVSR